MVVASSSDPRTRRALDVPSVELAADESRTDACGVAARDYAVAELGWPRLAAMTENVYREAIDSAERRIRPERAYSR